MNSEELEQSLKSEFELYFKQALEAMREDVKEFRKSISAEVEKHQSQLDEAFLLFASRFDAEHEFDAGFRETVVEHMRLARDEGAKITATAIAEAEELEKASMPEVNLSDLKEALNDISSKTSQATILKSLITQASQYTPRGAFFIIKNGEFVGWKIFGKEADENDQAVRDIHFPVESDSILATAVSSNAVSEASYGTYGDDHKFLESLQFGTPDRTYAIPLIARGHSVAVLYADYGKEGVSVNVDALEMLVRVAGLTVEMHATAKAVRVAESETVTETAYSEYPEEPEVTYSNETFEREDSTWNQKNSSYESTSLTSSDHEDWSSPIADEVASGSETVSEIEGKVESYYSEKLEPTESETEFVVDQVEMSTVDDYAFSSPVESEDEPDIETIETEASEPEMVDTSESVSYPDFEKTQPINDVQDNQMSPFASFDPSPSVAPIDSFDVGESLRSDSPLETEPTVEVSNDNEYVPEVSATEVGETERAESDLVPEPSPVFGSTTGTDLNDSFSAPPFDQPVEQVEQQSPFGVGSPVQVTDKVVTTTSGSRLSDRNVDLPIEVPDDERRLHNDARRFARLLVSEIKLYNEKTVQEGREANNLYERLREAIDRSREMYDKRVQLPVAEQFDYFHYELVNSLANGEDSRLGSSYPGSTV